jgi:hypothetical protein
MSDTSELPTTSSKDLHRSRVEPERFADGHLGAAVLLADAGD